MLARENPSGQIKHFQSDDVKGLTQSLIGCSTRDGGEIHIRSAGRRSLLLGADTGATDYRTAKTAHWRRLRDKFRDREGLSSRPFGLRELGSRDVLKGQK